VTIESQYNRTVFGFFVELEPGSSQTITINYQNPITIDSNYSLLIQKQSGAPSESYNINKTGEILYNGALNSDLEAK
jgi:hypothetical protein